MKNLWLYTITMSVLFSACSMAPKSNHVEEEESETAKMLLQGLWINDETEIPLIWIEGDTLYYADNSSLPVAFKVIGDSLKTYGSQKISYHIKKQSEYMVWIQTVAGDVIRLSKADHAVDSTVFDLEPVKEEAAPDNDVLKKDKVVYYNQVRYHGYVYINPSQIKVFQTAINENGFEVDKCYYDNIIHICVYTGENKLFGKDIKKQDFKHLIPANYYQRAILSDMDFLGVNEKGYQYLASVCIPNSVSCYEIHLSIAVDGEITYELAQ